MFACLPQEFRNTWHGEEYTEVAAYKPDMTGLVFVSRMGGRVMESTMTVTKNFHVMVRFQHDIIML